MYIFKTFSFSRIGNFQNGQHFRMETFDIFIIYFWKFSTVWFDILGDPAPYWMISSVDPTWQGFFFSDPIVEVKRIDYSFLQEYE